MGGGGDREVVEEGEVACVDPARPRFDLGGEGGRWERATAKNQGCALECSLSRRWGGNEYIAPGRFLATGVQVESKIQKPI